MEAADHPHLPQMIQIGDVLAPAPPAGPEGTGIESAHLTDLILKLAYAAPNFTTDWAARRLHLPVALVGDLLDRLRQELMLDVLGLAGPFGYRYSIAARGRERAVRALEVSGYVGPAPVSLESYAAMLSWQIERLPRVTPEQVGGALSELVLPDDAVVAAGMASSSGRSLFIFGPPGNGKTSVGRLLHTAFQGEIWVPHCVSIDSSIVKVFDPHWHQAAPFDRSSAADQRWVRIRRPFVVVGGEATAESFELTYSPSLRYYEAPLHLKANGGTFLIDDFGRERMDPHQLLNRWITPLEHGVDYLTLMTGQKVLVPLRQMLILATNLDPDRVMDAAFLRRMGYRLYLGAPSAEQYARIFAAHAGRKGVAVAPGLIERVLARYRSEGRELRACEPRDLIDRASEYCAFRGRPLELTEETLDQAWRGYFGNRPVVLTGKES
jgi:hypothetical protein